jgi:hypothetical protein
MIDPQTIALGPGITTTTLDPARDYIITLPKSGKQDTFIKGGHNIIIVGGHISTGADPPPWGSSEHRGIYIADATGVVHIEGVLVDNADVGRGDGIAIAAPLATVQIQNVRVVNLTGTQDTNHADVVQVWGGVKELRIDHLTGSTNYQGLTINPDLAPNGTEIIKNTDIYSTSTTTGNWLAWLTTSHDTCNAPAHITFDNVYITPRRGRTIGDSVWPPDKNVPLDDPPSALSTCRSAMSPDGSQISFPNLPQITGVIKNGPPPASGGGANTVSDGPDGAAFVPPGVAGPDYVSPGYVNN